MADSGYGLQSYGFGAFGSGGSPSPEPIALPIGYGVVRYGLDYYGLGIAAGSVLIPVSPVPDAPDAPRRPEFIVNVQSNITSTFFENEFSLVVDGVPLVLDGVVADGWSLSMTVLGTTARFSVRPINDSAGYLPSGTTVTALASYGTDSVSWNFTTVDAFTVGRTELLEDQVLRIYFNREPKNNSSLINPSNYGLNPTRGMGQPVRVNSVIFEEGNTYVDAWLSSTVRRSTFYNLEVTNVTDLTNEVVSL
jgi:hypothetical protein